MGPARVVALTFPRAAVPLRPDALGRVTGVRVRGDRGAGALVSSIARRLIEQVDNLSAADGERLGTAVLDLLAVGLATRLGRADDIPHEGRRRALLVRIQTFIETQLGDPELTPSGVAAAHYISIRYLHKLFETEQTTVADWIRRRRLDRCRRDLLDPAYRAAPVGAIGMRWASATRRASVASSGPHTGRHPASTASGDPAARRATTPVR